jgi:hypothetical protein
MLVKLSLMFCFRFVSSKLSLSDVHDEISASETYSLSSSLRSKLFNLKHTVEVEKLQKQMQLLENVCVSEAEISSCTT